MTESNQALLVLAAVVILPLLPAFLLFKFLPSQGDASGPLQGLTIKFGGSFAGYLVVFLSLLYVRPVDALHYHTWTVSGTLAFQHPEAEADPNVNDVFVRIIPPRLTLLNQGAFHWEIPVIETSDGRLQFPDLQLDLREYRGMTIPLGPDRPYGSAAVALTYDEKARRITLAQPIVMQSLKQGPAYTETKAVPAVVVK